MDSSYNDLSAANEEYDRWVREVRDPACAASEGRRCVRVQGAEAEYEIAPLPHGPWAIAMRIGYLCGNCSSVGSPWQVLTTRDACLELFLATARRHFGRELCDHDRVVNDAQLRARRLILARLSDSLFGFVEPIPDINDTDDY